MALNPQLTPRRDLSTRVHRMWLARGACRAVSFAFVSVPALMLLDAAAPLPSWLRCLVLATAVTAFGLLGWLFVVKRWGDRPAEDLDSDARREMPKNLLAVSTVALILTGFAATSVYLPDAGKHFRRVAFPWSQDSAAPFRIVVPSREPVVATGESITLSAYVEKQDALSALPESATLFLRGEDGGETALAMQADGSGTFHSTFPNVQADFRYRVEVEGVSTEWFPVTAIEAAEVEPESTLEVFPPGYAAQSLPVQTTKGFGPVSGYQSGRLELALRFSRPPTRAFVERRAPDGSPLPVIPVSLSSDRRGGQASLTLKESGTLRLVTVSEKNGRSLTKSVAVPVEVKPDRPPEFVLVEGVVPGAVKVRPGQSIAVKVEAEDDIAVAEVVIEYVIGTANVPVSFSHIPCSGLNGRRVTGGIDFELPGRLRESETVRYRLRVGDNRRSPDGTSSAQTVFYPAEGWAVVTVDSSAPPLEQQIITAQRNRIDQVLEKYLTDLKLLQDETTALKGETRVELAPHHAARLDQALERSIKMTTDLEALCREAALIPGLRPVFPGLNALRTHEHAAVVEPLRRLGQERQENKKLLAAILTELVQARSRCQLVMEKNRLLAEARSDCVAIEGFLASESGLIEQLKTGDEATVSRLVPQQRDVNTRFAALIAGSPVLKSAFEEAKAEELSNLVKKLREALTSLRAFDSAIKGVEERVRGDFLKEINRECNVLTEVITAALDRLDRPARIARLPLPHRGEFQSVESLVSDGKLVEALTKLQKLADRLETIAAAVEQLAADRRDPKLACEQLAAWQADLQERAATAIGKEDGNAGGLPAKARAAFLQEQSAISATLEALVLPPGQDLAERKTQILRETGRVRRLLGDSDPAAGMAMKGVSQLLKKLADATPTQQKRLATTQKDFSKFVTEQDQVQTGVKKGIGRPDVLAAGSAQSLANKLTAWRARQEKLLTEFKDVDLPGLETHRERALAALTAAKTDLEAGVPFDVLASQQWARWELERIRMSLDGVPLPERRVQDVLTRLIELHRLVTTSKTALTADQVTTQVQLVQGLQNQIQQTALVPAAHGLRGEAMTLLHALEQALQPQTDREELLRKTEDAMDAVRALSDRLTRASSDLERVQRLSWSRFQAVRKAEQITGKPVNRPESDEAQRQLAREIEDLLATRAGAAGQAAKQRAFEQYEKLKGLSEPDRYAGLHKALGESLSELAGLMADLPELTHTFSSITPEPAASEADEYLCSRAAANQLKELAARQRAVRERLNQLPDEVARAIRSGEAKRDSELAKTLLELRHDGEAIRIRLGDLESLLTHATRRNPNVEGVSLSEGGKTLQKIASLYVEGEQKRLAGKWADAEKFRHLAGHQLDQLLTELVKVIPEKTDTAPPSSPLVESVMTALDSLNSAGANLEKKDNRPAAINALERAQAKLKELLSSRGGLAQ